MRDDFAVFILSHGRPDRVYTYSMLRDCGYTGPIYIVIDNEDQQADEYYRTYGDRVVMFDKAAIALEFDEGDNFQDRRAVIYARNACFRIAQALGYRYFMECDDDYHTFCYRADDEYGYLDSVSRTLVRNLDVIFEALLEYYIAIQAKSIAVAQSGDYIGGMDNTFVNSLTSRRKCMNTFICSVDRPFQFVGRVNEDVNTYTWFQSMGNLFLTFPLLAIQQKQTQSNPGGMSEMYLDSGTYVKSFYTVMYMPSAVTVRTMGEKHQRLHHHIEWENAVPYIIPERYCKRLSRLDDCDTERLQR